MKTKRHCGTSTVGVAPVETKTTIDSHNSDGLRSFVVDTLTPETETTTGYLWGIARNFDIREQGFTERFQAQQGIVFAEDARNWRRSNAPSRPIRR